MCAYVVWGMYLFFSFFLFFFVFFMFDFRFFQVYFFLFISDQDSFYLLFFRLSFLLFAWPLFPLPRLASAPVWSFSFIPYSFRVGFMITTCACFFLLYGDTILLIFCVCGRRAVNVILYIYLGFSSLLLFLHI